MADLPNDTPEQRSWGAEQLWADAEVKLDKVLAYAESIKPMIHNVYAEGNQDISVVFDWWKNYITHSEKMSEVQGMGATGHNMTITMCAAALTRLMRGNDPRMQGASDVLAQLEKDMGENNNDDDR